MIFFDVKKMSKINRYRYVIIVCLCFEVIFSTIIYIYPSGGTTRKKTASARVTLLALREHRISVPFYDKSIYVKTKN